MKILASAVLLVALVFCFPAQAQPQLTSNAIDRTPLSAFDWTKNERLSVDVGKYSPMFEAVIRSMQRFARKGALAVEQGGVGHFYLVSRPDFPIKVTFGVLHGIWYIQTSRSDPKEGADAPEMLEIAGRGWKLKCRAHDEPGTFRVVATGVFQDLRR